MFVTDKNIYVLNEKASQVKKSPCFGYNIKEADKPASCAAELESGLLGAVDAATGTRKSLL